MRYPEKTPRPDPLPPERRTVGQLIAESIALYGDRFWRVLALGSASVLLDAAIFAVAGSSGPSLREQLVFLVALGAPLYSAAYVSASLLIVGRAPRGRILRAYALAVMVFLPFPFLIPLLVLPALAWLAFLGLSVPALLAEDLSLGQALRRGMELARVDFVHVLGGIAALVIVFLVARYALAALLHGQAGNQALVAGGLADLVLTPVVFVGSALLYVDQKARLGLRRRNRAVAA